MIKKKLEFIAAIFYRYYNKGSTKIIAYESALLLMSLIIFLNIYAILLLINIDTTWVQKTEDVFGSFIKLLSGIILILPQYVLLRCTLKKEVLEKRSKNIDKIHQWNWLLLVYILFSIAFLTWVIISR